MIRMLYTLTVVSLIGGTAWSAAGLQDARAGVDGGIGIVLLAALQP